MKLGLRPTERAYKREDCTHQEGESTVTSEELEARDKKTLPVNYHSSNRNNACTFSDLYNKGDTLQLIVYFPNI